MDICQRNGIEKLNYTGDTSGNLTMHKWFSATNCPGPYLESKFADIANEVNKRLEGDTSTSVLYSVQVGAFSVKENAENLIKEVNAAGFDTCLLIINGLYKVQVGAFSVKENAENRVAALQAKGFAAFITII